MTLAQMISSAFPGGPDCLCSPDEVPVARPGRRRKLWELPHAFHCALIGTCLPVPDMRRLAPHSGYDVGYMSDYSLHTVVVGYCEKRDALSEAIQRFLDKRHAGALARFAPAADAAAIAFLWREALARGDDIPGALWAAWTHPAMDDDLGRDIHGDIHMLSHQVGASVRADLRQVEQFKREAQALRQELDALRRSSADERRSHAAELAALRAELDQNRRRATQAAALERELAAAARERKEHAALQQRAAMLAARAEALEEWNTANVRRAAQLEIELQQARMALAAAQATPAASGDAPECGRDCPPGPALEGRCVLCVGGRSGLVDGYRKLVEQRGGRFLHHDGGQEEHLHRIDAAIASADAVVCQTGCVSHAAYWRLKDACKKLGKPCVFVQSPGVGSFARSLTALTNAAPTDQVIRLAPRQ
ncbi:MAG: DUF2325 domain-containing protein [Sterolibacteriaceae bacterium]|uniref:DUF2325 domain-containing protein n=1 Tax=Sulfuritalea sp. TaxID=2480090 RepID=UPI001A60834C|nr:DUF2325 domain-containing protein [Sulfuritalea sp.]MBL8479187.1 DUF2325 domain-containing protein [Sterolibacteriaceae bacterium]MBN8476211.1 DUF2325 domain-containing protein [Sulfuritalea sp.]